MRTTTLAVPLLAALLATTTAAAQQPGRWCLRGAPAYECRGMLRIEIRGGGSFEETVRHHSRVARDSAGTSETVDGTPWLAIGDWIGIDVGYVANVSDQWGAGASAAFETGNETTRFLVRGRARRWLGSRLYAEGLAGGLWQRRDLIYRSGDGLRTGLGVNGEARLGYAGWGFALVRYDVVSLDRVEASLSGGATRVDPGGTSGALSLGAGLEGPAALWAGALTLLVGGVLLLVAGGPIG